MSNVPNPGSAEAVAIGCTCAVIDNHYGKGFRVSEDGEPLFWITGSCPIHGVSARKDNDEVPARG